MGKIYVDSLEKPESGVAMLGDFCFLSGKTESEVIPELWQTVRQGK